MQQEPLKTAMPLTQAQIDAVNAIFADYELSTDDTLGHFAVNGFFTSTYDDVRDLNLNNFLAYFGECGEEDISEEEFAQLKDKWADFKAERLEDFPLPIHRYPAPAVEAVLQRFAGIGLADLKDIQEPFSGYTYLESTDAFYNTTSDYAPGYFICTGGEVNLEEEYARLYGSTAGLFSGEAVLKLVKNGENWYIHSFTIESPGGGTGCGGRPHPDHGTFLSPCPPAHAGDRHAEGRVGHCGALRWPALAGGANTSRR